MTTHVMIDLETLSTRKNAAIVQIAAVAFDPLSGLVHGNPEARPLFNMFVREQAGHVHIDPSTVAWWLQQAVAPALGKKIETTGVCLGEALSQFCAWFKALGSVDAVWSHGATFDIPIIETHCQALGLVVPWSYRAPRDTRTLYALAPGGMPAVQGHGGPLTHDALYDCEIQIKQVCGALKALRCQAELAQNAIDLEAMLKLDPRAAAPIRGGVNETHDDPPIEGGYTGFTSPGGTHSSPEAAF